MGRQEEVRREKIGVGCKTSRDTCYTVPSSDEREESWAENVQRDLKTVKVSAKSFRIVSAVELTTFPERCLPVSPTLASTVGTSLPDTVVSASTANIREVVVSLVVLTTTGVFGPSLTNASKLDVLLHSFSTNFDKYHYGYFGKVGMRYFHKLKNHFYSRPINVDKLWTLVPKEEKEGLTESSDVVPVIDTLAAGYTKVLGNGMCVSFSILPGCRRLMTSV